MPRLARGDGAEQRRIEAGIVVRPGRGVGIEAVDPGRCRRQCVCHDVPTIHTPNATTATPASRQAPSGSPNSHAPDSTTSTSASAVNG